MDRIPVTFEFEGKTVKGYFSPVSGGGANVFHLSVNNYHWGQLWLTEHYGWRFANNQGTLTEYTDYFADVVMMWYQ